MSLYKSPLSIVLTYHKKKLRNPHGWWQAMQFYIWLYLKVKKMTHRKRLKSAYRVLHLLNSPTFQKQPEKFFAYLRKMDALAFEELLLLCFKARGFKVQHNAAYTGDGGSDGMVIFPDNTCWGIQAKRYHQHIQSSHVKDFYDVVQKKRWHGGIFIHTGKTGKGVYKNLKNNIVLLSGKNLHQFITQSF